MINRTVHYGLPLLLLCAFQGCSAVSSDKTHSTEKEVQQTSYTEPIVSYEEVSPIISMSCMPCHNRNTIGTVLDRLEKHPVETLDGETRERVLAEMLELRQYMEDGVAVSFTSQEEVENFLKAAPGEFYIMLEKGVMPPSFAPQLMEHIGFDEYKPLSWDDRIKLLQYAKPYSKAYMR